MSKTEKLINKIMVLSKDLRFDEVTKVLKHFGYTMTVSKGGSSHYIFRKKGMKTLSIPKSNPVKQVYVEEVKHGLLKEAANNENVT